MIAWKTPNCIWPTAGDAEGVTELNSFDNALLAAGIGNLNLVKLSSICPANVQILQARPKGIEEGALAPTVYTCMKSDTPGDVVAAAIGIGLRHGKHGVMFENVGNDEAVVRNTVRLMVLEGFAQRGYGEPSEIILVSASHIVERIGCALAAVLLWWI